LKVRYYMDPETGLPHIYQHGVSEQEVEEILEWPGTSVVEERDNETKQVSSGLER